MFRSILLISLVNLLTIAVAQPGKQKSSSTTKDTKYILKVAPVIGFHFTPKSTAAKNNLPASTFSSGAGMNFLFKNPKNNNLNDVGCTVEIIPVVLKRTHQIATGNGYKVGVEYNYRFVYIIKNKPNFSLFTALGTQAAFTNIKTSNRPNYNLNYSSKSFEQNAVFTPGFQFSKNNFFLDFSVPFSIGYNHTQQRNTSDSPVMLENDTNQQFNMLQWGVGCKVGVGAKF